MQAANKVGQKRKDPKIEVIHGVGMVWCCVWGKVFVSVTTIDWITRTDGGNDMELDDAGSAARLTWPIPRPSAKTFLRTRRG